MFYAMSFDELTTWRSPHSGGNMLLFLVLIKYDCLNTVLWICLWIVINYK